MSWKELSITKNGLLIGIIIGILFGFYSLVSDCHIGLYNTGSNPTGCNNFLEFLFAGVETWIMIFFEIIFGFIINPLMAKGYAQIVKITLQLLSPIIIFGLVGILIGFIVKKLRK